MNDAAAALRTAFLGERAVLLRMLAARLRSAEDAEDVLQEVWLKIAQHDQPVVAQPGAYLFRMAANLALDRQRSAQRGQARDARWLAVQPGAGEYPDAERALLARDRLARVESAIAGLPERTGLAFRLYRLGGLTRPRIAERMGISVSAVEKLLHRAYRQIHDFEPPAVHSPDRRHQDATGVRSHDE